MEVLINCTVCGRTIYREKRRLRKGRPVSCSPECMSVLRKRPRKQITKSCIVCGTLVTRSVSSMLKNCCCSPECKKEYTSKRMKEFNVRWDRPPVTEETKAKLREHRLGTGEGKSYAKTYGRHTHRIVAEQILGRPLRKGEVVHHEDENKRNNDPSNLIIFASQAEHARYHAMKRPINQKKSEE